MNHDKGININSKKEGIQDSFKDPMKILSEMKEDTRGLKWEPWIKYITAQLRTEQNSSELWFTLGVMLSEEGKYEISNDALSVVARLNPENKRLWVARAFVFSKLGMHVEAAKCFQKALEAFGGRFEGYENVGELLRELREKRNELAKIGIEVSVDEIAKNVQEIRTIIGELLDEDPLSPPEPCELVPITPIHLTSTAQPSRTIMIQRRGMKPKTSEKGGFRAFKKIFSYFQG